MMEPIVNLLSGTIFKARNTGLYLKLMNPEMPRLARVSAYPVWAADIGNGQIKKFPPSEPVVIFGRCLDLIDGGKEG